MDLYVYQGFNNYFNKRIKRYETVGEYGAYIFLQNRVNFNPGDGVNTQVTLGQGQTNKQYGGTGDYLLAVEDGRIKSRWYILENNRTMGGQYVSTLRRDLIADFYDAVMDSTIYLERGWINNVTDPAIFNDEKYSPNQIKKSETPLMDKSKCKWLIGYVDKKAGHTTDAETGVTTNTFWNGTEMRTEISGNLRYDEAVSSWASWDLYPFVTPANGSKNWDSSHNIEITMNSFSTTHSFVTKANKNGFVSFTVERGNANSANEATAKIWGQKIGENYDKFDEYLYKALDADMSQQQERRLLALNGKVVYSQHEQEYIKISARTTTSYGSNTVNITGSSPRAQALLDEILLESNISTGSGTVRTYQAKCNYGHITSSAEALPEIELKNYKWQTNDRGHAHLINEAYDAFAIPIATTEAKDLRLWKGETSEGEDGTITKKWHHIIGKEESAFVVAQHLIQKAGTGGYDLQLVPYCPLEDSLIANDAAGVYFDVSRLLENFDYSIIRELDDIAKGCIFWLQRNSFTHTLDYTIDNAYTAEDVKKANQLDVYRLSSGDYSSQFEFSPVRNRGVVSFEADCTYKPYAPYVKIAPLYNETGLYGGDFNDMRGLVCSNTNYSISRAGDAWATYERNNLNYQNSWKREVEFADQMHKHDIAEGIVSAVTGSVGAGAAMGIATASVGGGLAVSGVSAAAGTADVINNHFRYKAQKENSIAAHNEQIANIKAQPNTLAATGANTINNKVFPLLIYFTCTDEEREAFALKLEYDGMTINRLTKTLPNYLSSNAHTFIRGLLMKIEVDDDNHVAQEIANELQSGVYIINTNYEGEIE